MSSNPIINNEIKEKLFLNLVASQHWDKLINLIQENQLDINYRDKKGRNALFWAINASNTKAVEKLLELKIDCKVTNNLTALKYAVYKDDIKIIKSLKNYGVNLDETDDKNSTALIYAVLYNKLNSINYLVDNGVNINHEDFLGNSAFSLAFDLKIKYLIDKFSNLSK